MKEILLTSSVLILAVLLLRQLFRSRISRRAQYALWALVLVRLLVPVSLPGADFSVLSAAEPVGQAVTERLEQREVYLLPQETVPVAILPTDLPEAVTPATSYQPEDGWPVVVDSGAGAIVPDEGGETATQYAWAPTVSELLTYLWLAGSAVMAVWFLVTNLRFWRKLRRTRTPFAVENCNYPVYLVEAGLPSPCLFGLIRPAIYLTPSAAASPERLGHVLAHETAHAQHGDPLWSLLRCVCLAVYWFDPLVWVAAAVSKTDGELACDEAAIRSLGDAERIPYGKTLLALIPVRRGPGAPLLSATTMTAGKRQLKDRITRIAQGNQTRAATLFLVLALAAGVCAVTFTGATADESPTGGEVRALTGDELAYFNEEFFNNDTADNVVGLNIHNQFLTSLYERPEDIDLFELFYCGTGINETMTDEELRQVGSFDSSGAQICPTDKLSVAAMNQVLLENTGLTLDETAQTGLENFQYLSEYDAYYNTHGDTNYFHGVQIAAGERRGGTIRLYYPDSTARYDCDWLCVTLEAQDDGSCWFVSNQPSEQPVIPTVYPEGEPMLTIPLTDLTPYEPETMAVTRHQDDCAERGSGYITHTEDGDELHVRTYLSTDGNLYAAVIYDEAAGNGRMAVWDVGCFFAFPEHNTLSYSDAGGYAVSMDAFSDLFGHDGLVLHYSGDLDEHTSVTFHDYYYFDSSGNPVLLTRVHGTAAEILDLDGNGTNELLSDDGGLGGAQLVFQRDGQLYEANLTDLLQEAWPEMAWWDYSSIDTSRRCLAVRGFVQASEDAVQYDFIRYLYFDGENILVYQDNTTYTDHVADGIDVPDAVLSAARDQVLADLEWWRTHTGAWSYVDGVEQQTGPQAEWDDWRITSLKLVDDGSAYPELGLRVYSLGYELHTATSENVMLAGGMYMEEGGWVGGLNTSSPYLVFHVRLNSAPALLESDIPFDVSPEAPMFAGCLAQVALENGLLTPSEVRPVDLYYLFYNNQTVFLNLLGAFSVEEQNAALDALAEYAATGDSEYDGTLLTDGLQNLEWNSSGLTEEGQMAYLRLQNAWIRVQAEAERQALLAGQAQGEGTVYTASGLSLWVPAGWADMAVVTARNSVWSGESVPGFDVYERLAHDADSNTGLVWNVRALTRAQFQSAFGDADWSEILGASSYVIGSDDTYIYLLSTPTDVQFLVEDPTSMAQYELLRDQSQAVLEDFLSRNSITPNPDCPDADGCYVGSASAESSPTRPTEADIQTAILSYQSSVLPMESDYCAEAHRVLQETSGPNTHTFHMYVYCTSFLEENGFPVQDWSSLFRRPSHSAMKMAAGIPRNTGDFTALTALTARTCSPTFRQKRWSST